jgi:hypothetical protein
MAHRKTTKRTDWAEILARWQRSGASQRGFCREEDISYPAFMYWRKKLSEQREDSAFVCVASEIGETTVAASTLICVRIGMIRAEFSGHEREEAIIKVLRAMREASCSSI